MEHKAFPPRWLTWMKAIFESGSSAVVLNGVLGKVFHYRRGVRQGDPLSPLLLVLATDFLQTIVNHAKSIGLLNLPLSLPSHSDFPILQYADDTLIFMRGDLSEPTHLKEILTNFAEASGVRVNYEKSMMIPINIADDRLNLLANSFGCSTGSLPFTYLGLPLSLTKPSVTDFCPLFLSLREGW